MFDEHAKARKKRNKLEENDFYDSDEDEFFDRTGELSQKREKRKKAAGIKNNQKEKAMTHQEILDKLKDCNHNRFKYRLIGVFLKDESKDLDILSDKKSDKFNLAVLTNDYEY